MKAAYVAPEKTPIAFEQAAEVLRWALKCELGMDPNEDALSLALAKTALETGRWTAIWRNNWGNVKAGNDYSGMFTCITLNEVLNKKLVWFAPEGQLSASPSKGGKVIGQPIPVPDGHPQTRMRAYANRYDGALSYVQFVANGRYREAWKQMLTGDASRYVHALKVAKYFTADESLYARSVSKLQDEMRLRLHGLPCHKSDIEWLELKEAVPMLQFSVDELLSGDFEEAVA